MELWLVILFVCFVFFFKQKTAYEIRPRDWSSDVCSSDLEVGYSTLTNLGIQWPGQASLSVIGAAGVPGQITGTEAKHFNGDNVRLSFTRSEEHTSELQ